MFEKLINLFRGDKKDPKVDHKVADLEEGYIFEYNLETWMVDKEWNYDWGDGFYSKEWEITTGSKRLYLFYDDNDGVEISVSKEINILQELNYVREEIINKDFPSQSFAFENQNWKLVEESPGLMNQKGKENVIELVCWTFKNSNQTEFISFNRTGEKNIQGFKGKYLKEFEFSNILPSSAAQ